MLQKDDLIDGKYRIVRPIGRGGMGVVYLGEHTRIKRQIAIKVLNKDVADADAVRRFEKEAQAAGAIGSEHIVEVIDLGTLPTGESFMVMEYLEGETLRQRIKERPLSPDAAVVIFDQLLEGLVAAHAAGIVHRDLKPDNVFLAREKSGRREFVKILDFGISKFAATDDQSMQTRTGTVMGTPVYMSPEQVKSSHSVDARSDVYSAGVILFQALTGKLPFSAGVFHELLFKIVYQDPLSPMQAAPQLDPALGAIVSKAMAREPKDRYPTARALQTALALWRADSAKVARVSSADLSATPAAGLAAFIDSAKTRGAPREPVELAPTEMSPAERGQEAEASAPASMPSVPSATTNLAPLETQKSWSPGSLDLSSPRPRRSQWMMIGIGATLTVLVGGALVMRLREPAATPAAPEQSGVVLPVSATVAAVEPTIAPAPAEPPLSPPEQPAASTSASAAIGTPPARPGRAAPRGAPAGAPRPATTAAAKPGEPDKAPRPSGTVSDFGY